MNYYEFLEEYSPEIDNKDFNNPIFSEFYGTDLWTKLMADLIKLGVNPLIGFKEIPRWFFHNSKIESIIIPNSVTNIGVSAFGGCESLTSITIPDSVMSIGKYAFNNCRGLTSITIGNGVTSIGEFAFYNCSSLTSVTIGSGVTSIGYEAFSWCNSLKKIIYKGNKQQFRLIKKRKTWKPRSLIEIECSDGAIKI